MCLLGLAGLGLEAVNELLQMGHFFLLLGKAGRLQLQLLGTQFFKARVIAAVAVDLPALNLQCDVGDGVQEFAVVADDDHRAAIAL